MLLAILPVLINQYCMLTKVSLTEIHTTSLETDENMEGSEACILFSDLILKQCFM